MKEDVSYCKNCEHHKYVEEVGFNNRDYCSERFTSYHTGVERLFVTRMSECKLINPFHNCKKFKPA